MVHHHCQAMSPGSVEGVGVPQTLGSLKTTDLSNVFYFLRLYLEQSDFHEKFTGGDVCVDRSSESVTCQTFELTLRSCLYPHIDKQYLECCGNLMQTLKKDYR